MCRSVVDLFSTNTLKPSISTQLLHQESRANTWPALHRLTTFWMISYCADCHCLSIGHVCDMMESCLTVGELLIILPANFLTRQALTWPLRWNLETTLMWVPCHILTPIGMAACLAQQMHWPVSSSWISRAPSCAIAKATMPAPPIRRPWQARPLFDIIRHMFTTERSNRGSWQSLGSTGKHWQTTISVNKTEIQAEEETFNQVT